MRILTGFLVVVPALTLSGCALLESTADQALASRYSGDVRAVATQADRRISFVDENWMWGEDRERENVAYRMTMMSTPSEADQYLFDQYRAHHYCAEPSPDASQEIVSQLTARSGSSRLGLAAGLDAQAAVEALFHRTQGVQLFRDGLFALCQAHHNGAVGPADYNQFIASLIERTSYLVALELALSPSAQGQEDSLAPLIRAALSHLAPRGGPAQESSDMMAVSELE